MAERYSSILSTQWDDVVRRSGNGTFQLLSGYMDYHRSRFDDVSLLLRDRKGHASGAFPACAERDGTVVSHSGLTYGGLLHDRKAHATDVYAMLDDVCSYYSAKGYKKLIYKAIPHIYHQQPCEADLYWLIQRGAQIYSRALSTAIDLHAPLPFSKLRKRAVNKAERNAVEVSQSVDFDSFWPILVEVLLQRHGVHPVHTLDEIRLLHSRFPSHIRLYTAKLNTEVVAGTVIYASRGVAHAQYIASNAKGRECGALDLLFSRLIADYQSEGYRWFDFGISTDHDGSALNTGLLSQKEGFGARSVCYDTYLLNL